MDANKCENEVAEDDQDGNNNKIGYSVSVSLPSSVSSIINDVIETSVLEFSLELVQLRGDMFSELIKCNCFLKCFFLVFITQHQIVFF